VGRPAPLRRPPAPAPALALAVGVLQVGITVVAARHQPERRDLDVLGLLLLAAGPVALVWRRRWPVGVLLLTIGTTLAYLSIGYGRGPVFLALIVAFVTAVMAGRRTVALATLPIGYVAFLWVPVLTGVDNAPNLAQALGLAAWLTTLGASTEVVRARRERAAEAARTHEEERRRRASDERLRIARELHDVVAHHLSLINVQAGVALHLLDQGPEQTRSALTAIRGASKDALEELRGVVDVLRGGEEAAPRTPAATLGDLAAVVERAAAAGLDVQVRTGGTVRPLPPAVDRAAYRIVQEALTNVVRHAGARAAVVGLAYADEALVVQVDDDGPGTAAASNGTGSGLDGMRERAVALGGRLEAGPRPGHGFRVRAELPLGGHP
jgi:signal transduction histidine kinase